MGNKISRKERERMTAEAKTKEKRSNQIYFVGMALLLCLMTVGFGYLFNGMALKTLPVKEDLVQISITDTRYTDAPAIITGGDALEEACTVLSLLRVQLTETEMTEEPMITVVYQMKDGTEKEMLLGETSMRWDGKDYLLKKRVYKMFLDIEPAYFFPEYVSAAE